MLVLTRGTNESIVVNEDIIIKVIDVRGKKVRLGIEAPQRVSVYRSEVRRKVDEAAGCRNRQLPR